MDLQTAELPLFLGVCFRITLNPTLLFKALSAAFNSGFYSTELVCLSITFLSPLLAAPFLCTGLTLHIPKNHFSFQTQGRDPAENKYPKTGGGLEPGIRALGSSTSHMWNQALLKAIPWSRCSHSSETSPVPDGNSAFLPSLPWRTRDTASIPQRRGQGKEAMKELCHINLLLLWQT